MDYSKENQNWDSLSYVEKNHQLYLKQKALLDQFLEKGAISQAQHDIVNMGLKNEDGSVCYIIGVLKKIRNQLNIAAGDSLHIVIEAE